MSGPVDMLGALQTSPAFEFAFRVRQPQPAQPRACVILLHGVGSSEESLTSLAQGIDEDTLVVLPRGPLVMGPGRFAWFRVSFTPTGPSIVEAEAEQSRLGLIRFVGQLQSAFDVDPSHSVIGGFSQGGIMSASTALSAPECVAGFAVLSGRILPELKPHLADRARLAALKAFIAHGEHDNVLPVMWAQRSDAWLTELGVPHKSRRYPIDHSISPAELADFAAWLHGIIKAG